MPVPAPEYMVFVQDHMGLNLVVGECSHCHYSLAKVQKSRSQREIWIRRCPGFSEEKISI